MLIAPNQILTPNQTLNPQFTQKLLKLILVVLLIFSLIIVGFLYWQNQQLKKTLADINRNRLLFTTIRSSTEIIPTPIALTSLNNSYPDYFKITINDKELLIDRAKFNTSEQPSTISLSSVVISPDKTNFSILAEVGLTPFFLYVSDITGQNVSHLGTADQVWWSSDGKYLAFTSPVTDIGPYNLYIYNVASKKISELNDNQLDSLTSFSNITWSEDSQSITANYRSFTLPGGQETASGIKTYTLSQFK